MGLINGCGYYKNIKIIKYIATVLPFYQPESAVPENVYSLISQIPFIVLILHLKF